MFVSNWNHLFKRRTGKETSQFLQVKLYVELDFDANVQVSYKNTNGQLKLKRFYGNFWSEELIFEELIPETVAFKVFVYTPNLSGSKRLKLGLELNEILVKQAEVVLQQENDYAGWFSVEHSINEQD